MFGRERKAPSGRDAVTSIKFEIETSDNDHHLGAPVILSIEARSDHAVMEMSNVVADDVHAAFTAEELRQLRRFLEYAYPASEDVPHDPDPWGP